MAKKGNSKISKVKRNNQTTNKMKKQGKLNLQQHRTKVQKQKPPAQPTVEYEHESDSPSEEEWADMLDDEEKQYILSRIAKQPQLLSDVPDKDEKTKTRKRKREQKGKMPKPKKIASDSGAETDDADSDDDVEDKYEQEMSDKPVKKIRPLLPIKTKQGLMERSEEVDFSDSEEEEKPVTTTNVTAETGSVSDADSGMEGIGDIDEVEPTLDEDDHVVSAVELMAARRDRLQHEKLRIGALCSSLLETPERKLKNLYPILYLMEERLKDGTLNLHSVRKIATISVLEVFKDILPDYQIRHQDYENVKLKKDTLSLYKYEKELLEFYKRYLQRLEKATNALRRKKGDTRKSDEATTTLAIISVRCLCGMLVARPQFNYATNIAQSVAPLLDCRVDEVRNTVTDAFVSVFNDDQRGEITLAIVRLINQLAKRRGDRLHPDALQCLLSLKIRDVDLDEEADLKHKKKQDEKHKKRIVNLSKKEKKRAKKLKEVERELLETEALESSLARKKQLTEVTKTVFHIYFRLLKTAPGSRLLPAVLQGLAKFTHVINLEFYSDLVSILSRLMSSEQLRLRDRILCVKTVLAVLSGTGDALNVDPAGFYQCLYSDVLLCHAGASHSECRLMIESVHHLSKRSRRVSAAVCAAFTKRILTMSVGGGHNTAIAAIALARELIQQCKPLSSLIDPDGEAGGRFHPELVSAEHCGALAAVLHELAALLRHFHPDVRAAARGLLGSWPQHFTNVSPVSLFDTYDGTQMALKPAVPPPQSTTTSKIKPQHYWSQPSLQKHCESVEQAVTLEFKDLLVKR